MASEITGVNENLIIRFRTILTAMNSGRPINVAQFKEYTLETAKLYVSLYPWFYMPSTIHKVLMHGAAIVESAILPIGKLHYS
jgi:hypothetical protein